MENLNKLSFKNYKTNENKIFIPMEQIKQEFDLEEYIKLYLFRLVYIHKYHSPTDTFICYLAPLENTNLPIIKAQIPLELIYTHKIIGNYNYDRKLEDNERYIIKEKIFRLIDKINNGYINYYVAGYGYLINKYKDDDDNTKIKEGIQMFNFTSIGKRKLKDRGFETYSVFDKKLDRILKILLLNKNPRIKKDSLKYEIAKLKCNIKFKELPEGFLIEK